MDPGSVVKAVYDFETLEDGELPLLVGDVVQVLRKVDKQWLFGVCNSRSGNFPSNFVIELRIPPIPDHQELFAALSDFYAQELGDLSFKRADLIVGTQAVDNNWWNGECNGQKGIFPLTHVWKMDQKNMTKPEIPKKLNLRAKVKMNMKAQLRAEMDLYKDEIVFIMEEVDKGWYRGECNGRSGIFPASFVTVLPDQTEADSNGIISSTANFLSVENNNGIINIQQPALTPNPSSQYGYDCTNSGIAAYGRALYTFTAEFKNELSFNKGEIVTLTRHVDEKWMEGEIDCRVGLFPKDFIEIIVDCPNVAEKGGSNLETTDELPEHVFPTDTYGRVLYDFHPQVEGDIKLREGDTVTLIRKMDQNWLEVITDCGEFGICPSSFIEVIGSGPEAQPPSYSEVMKLVNPHSNGFLKVSGSDNYSDTMGNDFKKMRPLSYPLATYSQFNAGAESANPGVDANIAKNLQDFDIPSAAHTEKMPPYSHSYSLDFGKGINGDLPSSFKAASSERANSLSNSFKRDEFSDVWNVPNVNSSSNFDSSSQPNSLQTSVRNNVKAGSSTQGEAKINSTPQRPPPPTIIWPANPKSRSTPALQDNHGPRKPLRRQNSETSSATSSSDGAEQNGILQQIAEKEDRIQKLEACRNKLKLEIESGSNQINFVSTEINGQIQQVDDEIGSLKTEIEVLRGGLPKPQSNTFFAESNIIPAEPQTSVPKVEAKNEQEDQRRLRERANKMKEQRSCVITEILMTERDYIGDLKIMHSTFLLNPEEAKAKGLDISTLFGNLDEVIELAGRLLRRLQKTASADPRSQMIGECFVDMTEDMKQVYGHYCRNHDDINAVLDKYDDKSPGGQFLKHKLEMMKRQTNCFDLPSMLIKPVQRILKYPLLLNELVKCTEDDHPDKQSLIKAIGLMTDVATAINEFKRRKDLVFKYRKHADTSLSGRISKINFHSMLKKSSRLGMRLSSSIGLRSVTKDEAFEREEQKFSALEKSIKIFLKDVGTYSEKTEDFVTNAMNIAEDIAELYQERKNQQEIDQFRSAHRIIVTQFWEAFKLSMDRSVTIPLQRLLRTYEGPNNLIQKRFDKLMDFEACTNKLEKNKDATKLKTLQDNQLSAKQMYEALNSQLLDDLPRLSSTSTDIFTDCIRSFLRARKAFVGKTARHMLSLTELSMLLGSQGSGILETFQVKHTLVMDNLCQLRIVPKHLFPSTKSDTLKKNLSPRNNRFSFGSSAQPLGLQAPQNATERAILLSSYQHSQLYTAHQDYNAADLLDTSINKGDLVGVIKQQDPMGSRQRWFVDKGSVKGFVPAKVLIKVIANTPQTSLSPTSVLSSTPLITLDENQITSATSTLPRTVDFRRNDMVRRSLGENVAANKSLPPPDFNVATRSLERNKPRKQLHPSRPAPAPQIEIGSTIDNSNLLNLSTALNYAALNGKITLEHNNQVMSNPAANISLDNVHQTDEAPCYEEIDDNLYEQARYEHIPDDVPCDIESASQSTLRCSNGPLDEFDPYSLKSSAEYYDTIPDYAPITDIYSTHRYEDIVDQVEPNTVTDEAQDNAEYYYSMYDFSPMGHNQLKLSKGQVVLVFHKCDLNGNPDWWFVEDRYQNKGYVPGNYLSKYNDVAGHH